MEQQHRPAGHLLPERCVDKLALVLVEVEVVCANLVVEVEAMVDVVEAVHEQVEADI